MLRADHGCGRAEELLAHVVGVFPYGFVERHGCMVWYITLLPLEGSAANATSGEASGPAGDGVTTTAPPLAKQPPFAFALGPAIDAFGRATKPPREVSRAAWSRHRLNLNVESVLWELRLRFNHHLLRKICTRPCDTPFRLWLSPERVILEIEPLASLAAPDRVVSGAYMHAEGMQIYSACAPKVEATAGGGGGDAEENMDHWDEDLGGIAGYDDCGVSRRHWYHDMLRGSSLRGVDIFIKTRGGVEYTCASGDDGNVGETGAREPGKKRARTATENENAGDRNRDPDASPACANIECIFRPFSWIITMGGEPVELRPVAVDFHLLWVNESGLWNGAPQEFLTALYNRIYPSSFKGVLPMFAYAFPGSTISGTEFGAYLPAFPFTRVRFGRPRRVSIAKLGPYILDSGILLHLPGVARGAHADLLLGLNDSPPGGIAPRGTGLTPWASELRALPRVDGGGREEAVEDELGIGNGRKQLCKGVCYEDEESRPRLVTSRAVVRYSHRLIKINIAPALCRYMGVACLSDNPSLMPRLVEAYASPRWRQWLRGMYEHITTNCISWATSRGDDTRWVYVEDSELGFLTPGTSEKQVSA
ncbi:DNA helicase/primase complex associated protein [Eptesicus fuscus gammaherpesvirus]|uniref:DNA helicase/primase complex associated protein n=1 Tax=vespertilionid gammaherpesvirus 3 TaxID=2846598 RepID=A0A2D0ZNZ3_9GAMA|nr:DNA helicase/primase complex associated protein [Eptesicus fuscus gammaherpesvirus]ATA58269.1 DNA helicase/primase complex associated protein [Eptesicus fuscus gammaherpesvirus]WAH70897.1 DNA helicase/primase complex-associated protein [Eptesicus fuscus gammaherpesvirus]